jgi:hypothetical membrane protein
MNRDARLLFGPLALVIFALGILILPLFVPGYDQVRQTVSEIGEMDSPMRWPFAALLWTVAACLIVFALALRRASRDGRHNALSAYLTIWMGIAAAALGWFAFPHPLHNVFGESELIGYQAPLAFALAWRRDPRARRAVAFSWIMYVLLWISLVFNMAQIVHGGALWHDIKPFYGLVQRSLFACFFVWSAGTGWLLWRRRSDASRVTA